MVDTFPKVEIQKILYLMMTVSQAKSGIFYLPGEERIIISKSSKTRDSIPEFDHFRDNIGKYHNTGLKLISDGRTDNKAEIKYNSNPKFFSLIFSFAISECNFAMVILFKDNSTFSLYNKSILSPHVKLIQKRIPQHGNLYYTDYQNPITNRQIQSDS